ncbi:5-formyltetrahydrofolate cyclo-ligase [Aquimarina sp. M1]
MASLNKQELRKKYKKLRADLLDEEVQDLSLTIANNLLKLPIWGHSFYHVFLSIEKHKEVHTDFILHILQGKDKNIVVSKSNFKNNTLTHLLLTDNTTLKTNTRGIPEPVDGIPVPEDKIEIVFVPLLAFDQRGNRVGYGKGFYDKFLSFCNPNVIKIGLSFFKPEETIKGILSTDIRLDYCVTPSKIYTFN